MRPTSVGRGACYKPKAPDRRPTQRIIASDPEAPEATDNQLAQARPFVEAFSALADAMRRNMGGRPKAENPSIAVSLHLD